MVEVAVVVAAAAAAVVAAAVVVAEVAVAAVVVAAEVEAATRVLEYYVLVPVVKVSPPRAPECFWGCRERGRWRARLIQDRPASAI